MWFHPPFFLIFHSLLECSIEHLILNWVKAFLFNRSTYFNINGIHSLRYLLLKGVPQGSSLSPILFLIFIDHLLRTLHTEDTDVSGFADDTMSIVSSTTVKENLIKLEKLVSVATRWAAENGQLFSAKKTELIHFVQKGATFHTIDNITSPLNFNNEQEIFPKPSIRLLGVIFDSKLTWSAHVETILNRVKQKWQYYKYICRKLSHLTYTMKRLIYKGIIEPIITYGACVWEDISPSQFKPITIFCNMVFRQICSAMNKSCAFSVAHEACVLPIRFRFRQIIRNQKERLQFHSTVFKFINHYQQPWVQALSNFEFIVGDSKKDAYDMYYSLFAQEEPKLQLEIYTDGSKRTNDEGNICVGAGFHWRNNLVKQCKDEAFHLPGDATIFNPEWWGLYESILSALSSPIWVKWYLFTDSKSVVQKLISIQKGLHPFYEFILYQLNLRLISENRQITIMWIPSHQGIDGNTIADELAEVGATSISVPTIIPFPTPQGIKLKNKEKIQEEWNSEWFSSMF